MYRQPATKTLGFPIKLRLIVLHVVQDDGSILDAER